MEVPVVCNPQVFTKEERARHFDLAQDILLRWPQSRIELPDGYLFSYEGDEERFLTVARWAAADHRCCAWATYGVEMGPFEAGRGAIRMRVAGTAEGKAFLTAALRYVDELVGGAPPEQIMGGPITHQTIVERLGTPSRAD